MHIALRTTLLSALVFFSSAAGLGRGESAGVSPMQVSQVRQDTADSLQESVRVPLWPDSAGEGISLRPRLRWRAIPEAVQYVLQVSPDTSFAGPLLQEAICSDTALTLDRALENAMRYYWRVGVVGRDSVVVFGSPSMFATGPPPSSRSVVIPDSRKDETTVACAVLYNHGVLPVTLDSLSHHPHLASGTRLPTVVVPGDSVLLVYAYRPLRFGTEVDTLVLYTDEGRCLVPLNAQCSPPVLRSTMTELILGPVAIDDSTTTVLSIVNAGPVNTLTVNRVRTHTQFFSVSFMPPRTIEPGDTLRIPVHFHLNAFRPDAFGRYIDTCIIESDGGRGSVVLFGDSPSPRFWMEPQMLSFGEVAAHDTAFATLRLMNTSVNTLRIDSVRNRNQVFRPMAGRMRVRSVDTVQIIVRYTPTQFGMHRDTLVLYNNSWWGSVKVPAMGIAPFPLLETGISRIDFGAVAQGDTAGVVVRITDGSISALHVETIRTRTQHFRPVQPAIPADLRKGDTLYVQLSFCPDSVRRFVDTLVIRSNGLGSPHRIPLSGDGVPPEISAGKNGVPGEVELYQNFPNPFRTSTVFRYVLPEASYVRLEIFTVLGQRVALLVEGEQPAGFHNFPWVTNVTSGVYYYRLVVEARSNPEKRYSQTRKMVVIR